MRNKEISIEETLEKEGITNIKPLDTLRVNAISKHVAQKLCDTFPNHGLNYKNLFIEIARLNMYSATMPDTLAKAKYYYKNSSIYFNENIDFADMNNLDGFAIHECIHYLQTVKDSNGELYRLGLCNFSKAKRPGIAMNEAAVQLLTTKCTGAKLDSVKYYGIELSTTSPTYYPLECSLINQMAYITGIGVLFESTLFSNNNFKNKFIGLTSKSAYETIELNIDYLMELEDSLSALYIKLEQDISDKETEKINTKISKIKNKIVTVFTGVQKLIYTTYFNNYYKSLENRIDIENFKIIFSRYKSLVGTTESNSDFDKFYIDLISKVDSKYEDALNPSMYLAPINNNFIFKIFRKLKSLTSANKAKSENYTNTK